MIIFMQMEYCKFQITTLKSQTNHNDQNSKRVSVIKYWNLVLEI